MVRSGLEGLGKVGYVKVWPGKAWRGMAYEFSVSGTVRRGKEW